MSEPTTLDLNDATAVLAKRCDRSIELMVACRTQGPKLLILEDDVWLMLQDAVTQIFVHGASEFEASLGARNAVTVGQQQDGTVVLLFPVREGRTFCVRLNPDRAERLGEALLTQVKTARERALAS